MVGFHASRRARDAFDYFLFLQRDNMTAERVEIRGWVEEGHDKLVGAERRVLAMLGPEETRTALTLWACRNALYQTRRDPALKKKDKKRRTEKLQEMIAYLQGKGPKPKKPRESAEFAELLFTVRGDYDDIWPLTQWIRGPKGSLSKILLRAMGRKE
jgi:hypothetical protein